MNNYCVFSDDRKYRYVLEHAWGDGPERLMFIGLNPSTADEQRLDPTLRRIRGFAKREGFSGFVMYNAYAYRSTDPKMLKIVDAPVGPDNMWHVRMGAIAHKKIVVGWGSNLLDPHHGRAIVTMIQRMRRAVYCLGVNKDGSPKHPLYVKADEPLQVYMP